MRKVTETGKRRMALGQGLDALLPLNEPASITDSEGTITYKSMDSLVPNPHQPRTLFSEESLTDLMESIKEIGVIQPLIVRPSSDGRYEIVAGERRWRAAAMAGFSTVPVIVRDLSDSESLEVALIENLQRENLNPLDTAEAYSTLITKFSYTHEILARRIGKDRSNITNHLRLLKLPDPIKEDIRLQRLSMGHARTLLAVDHLPTQLHLSRRIVKHRLSVRELEKIVQNYKDKIDKPVPRPLQKEPEISNLERSLSRFLSTRVAVRRNDRGSGKLEIHFHSKDELERILESIGFSEDFS
jgi:ParB family chromosome partitioning protein